MRTSVTARSIAMAIAIGTGTLLSGCGGSAGPAQPFAQPAASPACGTFQMEVVNKGTRPVLVRLDGKDADTVEAGATGTFDGYTGEDPMWHVEILDPATSSVLVTRDVAVTGFGTASFEITDNDGTPAVSLVESSPGGC